MAFPNPNYIAFYLDGRSEKLVRQAIDPDDLAEIFLKGGKTLHDVLHHAAQEAVSAKLLDKKKGWLKDQAANIKEAGGSDDEAWAHYTAGRVDELIQALEEPTIDALEEMTGDGEDDDDDDDDEDDEGEDDDGDD